MRTMRGRTVQPLSAVLIASLVATAGASGQQRVENQVEAVVDAFHAAIVAGDSTTALSHLAEDVTILESGRAQNKEEYRSGHLAGDMRFAGAVPSERGEMEVRLMGNWRGPIRPASDRAEWVTATSIRRASNSWC
ncbi:MAG TPA: hypothetical protein EYQ27_20520 [Gemmatimonadetes bacterium]|nr:hypothetical protein [Gemmatimonadota bacterium]